MSEIKLWALYLGNIWLPDKGLITSGVDVGKAWCAPVLAWYIDHPDAKILVDTGIDPEWKNNWPKEMVEENVAKKIGPQDNVVSRLEEIRIKPDDIDIVVNTHLHADHAGGNRFFKQATFVVQKDEIRYAYFPDPTGLQPYLRSDFDHSLNYSGITGDYEVVKGIQLIRTPGHTPGHQSVILRLKHTGTVILTGDAAYGRESIGPPMILPNIGWLNQPATLESMARLKHIADLEHGRLFFTHDSKSTGETLDGTSQWETELRDKCPFL